MIISNILSEFSGLDMLCAEIEYFLGKVDATGSNMSYWQEEDGIL